MKISFGSLFGKGRDTKEIVKQWIVSVEKEQNLPENIVALNFGLYEPYGIELTGANRYDPVNDDWACEEDYVPEHRTCPPLGIPATKEWEEVLWEMAALLKDVMRETPELSLWRVKHITVGFSDGDLVVIR